MPTAHEMPNSGSGTKQTLNKYMLSLFVYKYKQKSYFPINMEVSTIEKIILKYGQEVTQIISMWLLISFKSTLFYLFSKFV